MSALTKPMKDAVEAEILIAGDGKNYPKEEDRVNIIHYDS